MSQERPTPRLLLVEDDPVSQGFLAEALAGLPARVDVAADIAGALAHARAASHALWIVDAHLPDGDGADCLIQLRQLAATPALAVTAGASRQEMDALCAAGYLEVLQKPVGIALLQGSVRRLLGDRSGSLRVREPGPGKLLVWDEERALAAIGGNRDSLLALRKLFLDELPGLRGQVDAARARNDPQAMAALLHKLKASTGFVGAMRLNDAVSRLEQAPLDDDALLRFGFAVDDVLASNQG